MPLVIPKLTSSKIAKIKSIFEDLYGIPLILGAIDGSHIIHHCSKSRYKVVLLPQGILLHFDPRHS
jgi:hypothetical protein